MPHLGIAVATTLGGWLNAVLLYRTLAKREHFTADARLRRTLPMILLSSADHGRRAVAGRRLAGALAVADARRLVRGTALATWWASACWSTPSASC